MRSRIVAASVSLALGSAIALPAAAFASAEPAAAGVLPVAECKLESPITSFNEGFPFSTDVAASTGALTVQVVYAQLPDHPVGVDGDPWVAKVRHDIDGAVTSLETLSHGRVDVEVRETADWVMMPNPEAAYPESGDQAWGHAEMTAFVTDAVAAADPAVDYTGVDVVWVVFPWVYPLAGRAQATNDLAIPVDGGAVTRAVTLPFATDGVLTGTIVHETGHTFGLPDLYDTSSQTGSSSYLGAWDPMSDADGEDFGSTVEFMGWHLWRLGWIDDEQVTCVEPVSSLDVTLDALTGHGDSVIAVVPTSEHRAVVIESRKAERFNAAIPRPGVLIYVVWTDTAFGPVLVGPRDGTEFPTSREGFANATLMIGDSYTDPVTGFTVTVVDSTDASDTVRIQPSDVPTESPVDPGTEPAPPADPNTTPAGGTITMLPPTGMDATGAVVLTVALLLAGALLRSGPHGRRPSPERRASLR
jgi:M6 family metalloprotease-like protein